MDLDEIITNSICKFTKLANQKILEIAIYKNFFLDRNSKGICFVWFN